MVIIQDQREKYGHHSEIEGYCKSISLSIVRKRLNVGDYMLANCDNGKVEFINNISVDTKQDLAELSNDLWHDQKEFNKKYKKCYHDNIKLYVLIQQPIRSIDELIKWHSKHTKITGRLLFDMINTLRYSYGIKFLFCRNKDVGECVVNLLSNKPCEKLIDIFLKK